MASNITVIGPRRRWARLDLKEVWDHRNILWVLASREVKVRYKQTLFGAAWAVLQPLMTMVVFSIFFGRLANIPSDGVPYPIFCFTALLPWTYFSHSLAGASSCLVDYRHIISKVYFPRILLPFAPLLSNLVDFGVSMMVLLAMMAWYGIFPTVAFLLLPVYLAMAMLTVFALGLWLAALSAHYRDFRYVVPFLLQLWLFVSPIAYPSSLVPSAWRIVYWLNPMAGIIEGFRNALLGTPMVPSALLGTSLGMVVFLLITGLAFFRRVERTVVDVV